MIAAARRLRARAALAVALGAVLLVPAVPAAAAPATVTSKWSSAGWLQVTASAGDVSGLANVQRSVTVRACAGAAALPWSRTVSGSALRQVTTGQWVSFPSVVRRSELPAAATGVAVTVTTTYTVKGTQRSFAVTRTCAGSVVRSAQR